MHNPGYNIITDFNLITGEATDKIKLLILNIMQKDTFPWNKSIGLKESVVFISFDFKEFILRKDKTVFVTVVGQIRE